MLRRLRHAVAAAARRRGPPAPTAGEGLDATKLTTVDRTDGTKQVKYGDWPLYYFAGDSAAGDANGQGLGEKWFVVDASGALYRPVTRPKRE